MKLNNEIPSQYWICKIRSFVKKLLSPCVVCKRLNARALQYPSHSDLPVLRFDSSNAINSIGVDYLGPLFVLPVYGPKNKIYKAYIVLYTCTAARGLILEVTQNASANTFVNCLKRFIARRGCPSNEISDQECVYFCRDTVFLFK